MSRSSFSAQFDAVLRRHVAVAPDTPVPRDADLNAIGLDSLGIVTLLVDLEETFGVAFPGALLTPATFRTAATLEHAVASLAGVPA